MGWMRATQHLGGERGRGAAGRRQHSAGLLQGQPGGPGEWPRRPLVRPQGQERGRGEQPRRPRQRQEPGPQPPGARGRGHPPHLGERGGRDASQTKNCRGGRRALGEPQPRQGS